MKTSRLPISFCTLFGVLISCELAQAQDAISFITKFIKVDGHYEYNPDGVPVLGLITAVLPANRVKFTLCSNRTMELELKQLKASLRKCEQRKKDDIWTADSQTLLPMIKAKQGTTSTTVTFQGRNIDLTKLPAAANYTEFVAKAKPGDWVGYVFTAEDGTKSAAILEAPVQ